MSPSLRHASGSAGRVAREETSSLGADRPGPATLAAAGYALLYLAWERTGWGGAARDVISNIAFMPLNLAAAVLFMLGARHETVDDGVRQALRLLGIAFLCVLAGNSISTYYIVGLASNPPVSWADAFYLTNSLLLLSALLAYPRARRTRLEHWKFVLDAAMVLVGGGVAIWYFAIRPTAASDAGSVAVTLLAFAFPLASLLVLLGATTVLLGGPLDPNRRAFRLVVASIVLSIVADLTFDLAVVETGGRRASLIDAIYLLVYLLLIAGGEIYARHPVARPVVAREREPRTQEMSPLPYLAVATTYALLLWSALDPWIQPVSGIAAGAVLITVLVVTRQVLAVRENVRLLAETSERQNEARFRSLVQHSSDVIIVVRPDGTIRFVSPSATRVLRYDPHALIGRPLTDLLHSDDQERARAFVHDAALTPGVTAPEEWRFRQPDGSMLHAETIGTNLLDEPTVRGIVLNTRDVSDRKQLEQELVHQAFHDPLTGLANRALFRDRVSHALDLARRQGRAITVLFLDLDDFKKVNDSLGHAEGDRLLIAAAERFRTCARVTDTVARLGGDEFAILLEDGTGCDGADGLTERLAAAMQAPFLLGGNPVPVNASIGIATAAGDESADDLLRNADVAMYAAKRGGRGRSATYQTEMYDDVRERLERESALRAAVEREELVLHYQPIVCLRSGTVRGVEALVRWNHPRYGLLLAEHFVPLAEETGLILKLGDWVLREGCAQLRRWQFAHSDLELTMAINISGRQLHEREIVESIRGALTTSGVNPAMLTLEITESVLMQNTPAVLQRLRELKKLGVRLAIDDFGVGYSSLSYLRQFPIDILKIAKPFVDDVGEGIEKVALARAIIGLGQTLKLRTVAEGIERAEQRAALTVLGCELGQGHYFAPAMEPERLESYFAESPRVPEADVQPGDPWLVSAVVL
ncbi:MAG TPA: EAL domain-containing protein [Gemmatimonadales bacterium]|nr:EAL domain-containing protein [Gemmatimonadales bacterium]